MLCFCVMTLNRTENVWLRGCKQAQSEVAALRAALRDFEKNKEELGRARGRAAAAKKRLKALDWAHEVAA